MDKQRLADYGIDYENGIARFGGNETLYEKFLKRFNETPYLQPILEAWELRDDGRLLEETHALKGICATLGIQPLYKACAAVVCSVRYGKAESLEEQVEKVKEEYGKAKEAVERF